MDTKPQRPPVTSVLIQCVLQGHFKAWVYTALPRDQALKPQHPVRPWIYKLTLSPEKLKDLQVYEKLPNIINKVQ